MPLMTSKGQVTVPEPVRRKMGWKPGDTLTFEVKDDQVVVSKALDLDDLVGIVQVLSEKNGDPPMPALGGAWEEQREQAWHDELARYGHPE